MGGGNIEEAVTIQGLPASSRQLYKGAPLAQTVGAFAIQREFFSECLLGSSGELCKKAIKRG